MGRVKHDEEVGQRELPTVLQYHWLVCVNQRDCCSVRGADAKAQGGRFGNTLQAGTGGYEAFVRLLLEAGAEVNAEGGYCGTAL
jgi:hypothetical protein